MNNALTKEDIMKLQEELDYRMSVVRGQIAREKAIAAAFGDRSENAEYKDACERYHENDDRIQYLYDMIASATIIEAEHQDQSVLGLNSKARVRFVEDEDETVITLVTTLDIDPANMRISIESDLGRALTSHKAGETVEVNAPQGTYSVEILEIL